MKKSLVILLLLGMALVLSLTNVQKCEAYNPGGVKVKLLPDPAPSIHADISNIYSSSKQVIPIYLQGTCDNSDTSAGDFPFIGLTGLSFICDIVFSSSSVEADITPASLKDAVDKAFALDPSIFNLTLDNYPGHGATINNTKGFNVVNDPTGKPVLRITMRGDSESGVASMLWDYVFKSGLPKNKVPNHISLGAEKHVLLSAEGLPFDESPNKVNTKGFMFPSQNNKITGTATFYDWDQCQTDFWNRHNLYLINGAKPSNTMKIDVPTWSVYISPWDSKNEYNLDPASFDEVKGINTQLPGGYLTPTIQWNLRKDGFPTAEMVAKRFGRVVNIFNKTIDTQSNVQATTTKTSQGADFVLSSSDQRVLQRSVTLKTLFKAQTPQLLTAVTGNKSYGRQQAIDLTFSFVAPTSQNVTLWESVDQQEFHKVQTYDLSSSSDPGAKEQASLPPINQVGKHTLRFKLTDSNGLESNWIDSSVMIDQRELTTQDSVIYQYDSWDKKSNIKTVTDRDGHSVNPDQVMINGKVDTNKVGVYPLIFSYDGMETQNEVKVLETKSSLDVQDINLTVGDSLNVSKGFRSATDNAGNPLTFDKVSVSGADKINTNKVGDYSLTYSLKPISPVEKTVCVHVKAGPLSLSKLPNINFPNTKIDGKEHWLQPVTKDLKFMVTDKRGLQSPGWQLLVKYNEKNMIWKQNQLDLHLTPQTEDPGVDLPESDITINDFEQQLGDVPTKFKMIEKINSTIFLKPRLEVSKGANIGRASATVEWCLLEAPTE
ncbi:bacterial Ig-like domain-containing protein [Enterococcus faecalis]